MATKKDPKTGLDVDGLTYKHSKVVEMVSHKHCNHQFELPKKYIQACPWCHALLPTERPEVTIKYNVNQEGGE